MTQEQIDIIHEVFGYALRTGFIEPDDYDNVMLALFKEYPEFMQH